MFADSVFVQTRWLGVSLSSSLNSKPSASKTFNPQFLFGFYQFGRLPAGSLYSQASTLHLCVCRCISLSINPCEMVFLSPEPTRLQSGRRISLLWMPGGQKPGAETLVLRTGSAKRRVCPVWRRHEEQLKEHASSAAPAFAHCGLGLAMPEALLPRWSL